MPEPQQAPKQIEPKGLPDYLEVITKAVFQSGMSWRVIEAKWDGFQKAFKGFDPKKIARFGPDDVDRLAHDPGIIRNRRKIEATIDNAVEIQAPTTSCTSSGSPCLLTTSGWPHARKARSECGG